MDQRRFPFTLVSAYLAYMSIYDGLRFMNPNLPHGGTSEVRVIVLQCSIVCSIVIGCIGALFPFLIRLTRWFQVAIALAVVCTSAT